MATAAAPGSMEAKVVSLETQLANVRAQADADAINAEHMAQAMEQRYAALAAEHAQVRPGASPPLPPGRALDPATRLPRGSVHTRAIRPRRPLPPPASPPSARSISPSASACPFKF